MSDSLKSPFQCGGQVVTFPSKVISGRLTIRVEETVATDKVLLKLTPKGGTVAVDNADMYLLGGESYEIQGGSVPKGTDIQILNVSGDPLIYWCLENI